MFGTMSAFVDLLMHLSLLPLLLKSLLRNVIKDLMSNSTLLLIDLSYVKTGIYLILLSHFYHRTGTAALDCATKCSSTYQPDTIKHYVM